MCSVDRSVAFVMTDNTIVVSPGPRFRTAMVLAILADALQVVVFPLFVAGAASPADDILDFATGTVMVHLLGWHWEFLPSFLGKLVPGVDLVPSGRWRSPMSIGSRSGLWSPQKRFGSRIRR